MNGRRGSLTLWLAGTLVLAGGIYGSLQRAAAERSLIRAIEARDADRVAALLNGGVNPNVRVDRQFRFPGEGEFQDDRTALMVAVEKSDLASVHLLLRHGADPNVTERADGTALCRFQTDAPEIARELISAGADTQHRSEVHQQTPLIRAAQQGFSGVVRELLAHDARLNLQDSSGHTALSAAALYGHTGTVRVLLEYGADPNIVADASVGGALTEAAVSGKPEIVRMLLEHGARVNDLGSGGSNALDRAARFHGGPVAAMLRKAGAQMPIIPEG